MRTRLTTLPVFMFMLSLVVFANCYASMLRIAVADPFVRPGERINACIEQASLGSPACGYQVFLTFDSAVISLDPSLINPWSEPYGLLVYKSVSGSEIDVAAGINVFKGQTPATDDAKLCNLTFETALQDGTTSIRFRGQESGSRLTDPYGDPIIPELVDSPQIFIDGTPPVITSKPADITVPNDPGLWTASVYAGSPVASDSTSGVGQVSSTRSDGLNIADPYPAGLTTVRWTVADRSGNITTCTQRVVVYVVGILEPVVLNPYVKPGEKIYVDLCQSDLLEPITGFQAFLGYDSSMISIVPSAVTIPREPYGLQIWKSLTLGTIDIAAGINTFTGQQPNWADATIAKMTFTAGTEEGVTTVNFRDHDPKSLFTDLEGMPIYPSFYNSREIIIDGTPPVLVIPQDILVTAPAGSGSAVVSIGTPMASDPLSGMKSLVGARSDGKSLESPYPVGGTGVVWTATDMSGNKAVRRQLVVVAPPGFHGVLAESVAHAKQFGNGTKVALILPVVTASLDGCFYLEDADRAAGIRVDHALGLESLEGNVPVVFGTLASVDGERVISGADAYSFEDVALIEPLGLNGRALENPISQGLLVKLCGRVASDGADQDEFVLLDGSLEGTRVRLYGVTLPGHDNFTEVTGVVGFETGRPVLKVNKLDNVAHILQ